MYGSNTKYEREPPAPFDLAGTNEASTAQMRCLSLCTVKRTGEKHKPLANLLLLLTLEPLGLAILCLVSPRVAVVHQSLQQRDGHNAARHTARGREDETIGYVMRLCEEISPEPRRICDGRIKGAV